MRRKVQAGDGGGPPASETERVGANVTLQMNTMQACYVAKEWLIKVDHGPNKVRV
jgi:hypothetical protein